jgi:undecaprenyl-diphosphatase
LTLVQITVLAVLQGITEFLPVSSSGHLILVSALTGWPDQGLMIDVAVHAGTLGAVFIYFWRDLWAMFTGLLGLLRGRGGPGARLVLHLIIGTIPALAIGLVVSTHLGDPLRRVEVVAWSLPIFGLVLWAADRIGLRVRRVEHMTGGHALIIGIAQTLAFVPGTSRSGITMAAARILGYERVDAARFSFLLSIPAIAAAGIWEGRHLFEPENAGRLADAALSAGISCAAALAAIAGLMAWLRRAGFLPFVIYRLALGAALLAWIYVL